MLLAKKLGIKLTKMLKNLFYFNSRQELLTIGKFFHCQVIKLINLFKIFFYNFRIYIGNIDPQCVDWTNKRR